MSLKRLGPRFLGRSFSSGRSLEQTDPQIFQIIKEEERRQTRSLNFIASENFPSQAVSEALGSRMVVKYSEGYPGARYYGGTENIDVMETLCQERALKLFRLDPEKWGVNVQPLSGCNANIGAYNAILNPTDRLMSLYLPHGGHLSHGYAMKRNPVSAVAKFYQVMQYRLAESTSLLDYDEMAKLADQFHPKLLVAGFSAYPRALDFGRFREIADRQDAYLLTDMSHIAGLVAGGVIDSPFDHSDIVTTTTHKSLRGPRGAMIFFRKGQRRVSKKGQVEMYDLENKINRSIFPGLQGGPHNHTITAIAVALHEANSAQFREYQAQVLRNAKVLAQEMMNNGVDVVSNGTDNHLVLLDLRSSGVSGAMLDVLCNHSNMSINKNTILADTSAVNPSGARLGAHALTTAGLKEADFKAAGQLLLRGIEATKQLQTPGMKLKDFTDKVQNSIEVKKLAGDVEAFMSNFNIVH